MWFLKFRFWIHLNNFYYPKYFKIGNSLVPNLLRFVVVSEQCVKTVAEFKHHLILQNLINILSYLLKPNLTYCMLARPKRPTRAWHQVPGVTSTKIITIQVFFPGWCQKNLIFWLGLCQFSNLTWHWALFSETYCKIV